MWRKVFTFILVVLVWAGFSWQLSKFITSSGVVIPRPQLLSALLDRNTTPKIIADRLPHTDVAELEQLLQSIRTKNGQKPLERDTDLCIQFTAFSQPDKEAVFSACAGCRQVAIVKISSQVQSSRLESYFENDDAAREILLNPDLTHVCFREKDGMHTIFVMEYQETSTHNNAPARLPTPRSAQVTMPQEMHNFTEDELWQALIQYRQAHGRTVQTKDEKLCTYARKRVQDHLNRYLTTDPQDYPVPEKYPLDAHAGFATDADSGYAFEVTGKNRLAENLAYWPSAAHANHVIEWGWDSSTEGHREAQLSNDYGFACISGRDGFYVAIFGN